MMKTEELKKLIAEYPDANNYNEVLKGLVHDYGKEANELKKKELLAKLEGLIDELWIKNRFYKDKYPVIKEEDMLTFLDKHEKAGEYHCHFEYEDWETGNREADCGEYFDTLKGCYEDALTIINQYKRVDPLVILNDDEEVIMSLNPNSDKYEWVKGGDDW